MTKHVVHSGEYTGEDLGDMARDMHEMWNEQINPKINRIPESEVNEHGIHKGKFRVTATYCTEDDCDCPIRGHRPGCQHWVQCY